MRHSTITLLSLLLFCAVSWAASAQTPMPTPAALPAFEAYIGVGQVATSTAGNVLAYHVGFETNVFAGFRWFPIQKFAINTTYSHDTVRIGRWLVEHNFTSQNPIQSYEYSSVEVNAEYWFVRDSHGGVFVFLGPNYFLGTGGQSNKLGLDVGVGAQYAIGHFFVEGRIEYWHVQDFMLPVANTEVGRLAIGYKF